MQSLTSAPRFFSSGSFVQELNSEEIVNKIIETEKSELQAEKRHLELKKSPFAECLDRPDSYWEGHEKLYIKIEKWLLKNRDEFPSWHPAGPLNYGMSLGQMKDAITKKFQEMAASGNLMTEKQLDQNHKREFFYPETGKGSDNLTRIWGAEFLKSHLQDSSTMNAAEHFLIVNDSASEIEVQVWHNNYPYLSTVKNAYILSQKIEGDKQAWSYRFSGKLDELQYRDFTDPGNIIRDAKGIGWIVDTELKSFDPPHLTTDAAVIRDYLPKRFKALTGQEYRCLFQTFKVAVADLHLN
jgi:hypothetical protein